MEARAGSALDRDYSSGRLGKRGKSPRLDLMSAFEQIGDVGSPGRTPNRTEKTAIKGATTFCIASSSERAITRPSFGAKASTEKGLISPADIAHEGPALDYPLLSWLVVCTPGWK